VAEAGVPSTVADGGITVTVTSDGGDAGFVADADMGADVTAPGCTVGGAPYAAGATDPANACQECTPSASTVAWTPLADGTGCGPGDVCAAGACTAGCWIGGAFYAPDTAKPGSACESCQPAMTTSTWSNIAGSTCAKGGTGASCSEDAGMTRCGANNDSCCTSLEVSGGTYFRTYGDPDGGAPADPATISDFALDEYLVTVGRFRRFVEAWNGGSGYLPAAGSGKHAHLNGGQGLAAEGNPGTYEQGWLASDNANVAPTNAHLACNAVYPVWTANPGTQENLPINCVNWYEAYAFCIWDGGFLPSEAEWEYAAAGGSAQRKYPWGSTDPGSANQYAIYNCDYPSVSGNCNGAQKIAPVGSAKLGAGLWGQEDLVGELWEWDLDFGGAYAACTDCANLQATTKRVVRGSNFIYAAADLLPTYRNSLGPATRLGDVGFRCARSP
jgi:formylglycine-generating enzyme required for sulfatase activity